MLVINRRSNHTVGIISQHAQCLTTCTHGSSLLGVSVRGWGVQCLTDPRGPLSALCPGGWGEALLRLHLLKAGPYSSVTIQAPSLVTWSCVHTHIPTGMCTCELQVQYTGNEASRPACLLSLRPLGLPVGMATPKGSRVVAGCSGSCQGLWDVVMRSGRALGVYYMGPEAGTSDVHSWFGPVCDYAKANTLLILSPQVRHMDFFLKMGMTRVHCGFFFFKQRPLPLPAPIPFAKTGQYIPLLEWSR